MRLIIEKAAAKRLSDLPLRVRAALERRLAVIAADPFAYHANVKRLHGGEDMFRLRQGDWRVVYRIDRVAGALRVRAIEPRGSAYE